MCIEILGSPKISQQLQETKGIEKKNAYFRRRSAHLLQIPPAERGNASETQVSQPVETLKEKVDRRNSDVFAVREMNAL
jgi:hypothetical protein